MNACSSNQQSPLCGRRSDTSCYSCRCCCSKSASLVLAGARAASAPLARFHRADQRPTPRAHPAQIPISRQRPAPATAACALRVAQVSIVETPVILVAGPLAARRRQQPAPHVLRAQQQTQRVQHPQPTARGARPITVPIGRVRQAGRCLFRSPQETTLEPRSPLVPAQHASASPVHPIFTGPSTPRLEMPSATLQSRLR